MENISELTLIDNRALASFETLANMSWLRSLHIERSEERSLAFISNMTNLESLTIIRTDTRSFDFILPLTNLRYLRLFDNRDVQGIPSLAGFTQLEDLHLDTGRNTGTVRSSDYLEGLTSVRRMTLHNPDTVDSIRGMQNLEELDISFGWLFTDAQPLGALSSLQRLRIYDSRVFSSEVLNMNAIGQLTELRVLDMSSSSSGNEIYFNWDFIYGIESLEELYISNNNIIGDFSGIGRLQNLRILHMDNVRLMSNFSISSSGGMVSISHLGQSDVSDYSDWLSYLSRLEFLSLSGNGLSDISFISTMQNLQVLNLEDNFVADVSPLSELTHLELVDLRRNPVANWATVDEMINTTFLGR
jgi:Leucine-rich repeat (LRR) protein